MRRRGTLAEIGGLWSGCAVAGAIVLMFGLAGCARSFYRRSADREVQRLIAEKAADPRWSLERTDTKVDAGPESRFFDPNNLDLPPIPEDDPAAHELMKHVDGMRGIGVSRKGPPLKSDKWMDVLPWDEQGNVVLDLENVVEVGLRNSRDFQREREDLYLSALDVSFERYRFDAQFSLGTGPGYTARGEIASGKGRSTGRLTAITDGSVRWLSATGGEIIAGFANNLVWNYDGTSIHTAGSLLNLSIVQPLLRLGGRAWVLEGLTQSERRLLANVRQMEQFQHGYYIRVTSGRNAGEGPSRNGAVGASGLGLISGTPSGRVGAPRADGLMGLIEEQQRIRNLEGNVARLRESLDQFEAAYDAGRITNRLQVDQARQALYNGQSSLLATRAAYQTRLDSYKIDLGLPPELPLVVRDPILERLALTDSSATSLSERLGRILAIIRNRDAIKTHDGLQTQLDRILALRSEFETQIGAVRADVKGAREGLPDRRSQLQRLREQDELDRLSLEDERLDPRRLEVKLALLEGRSPTMETDISTTFQTLESWRTEMHAQEIEPARARVSEIGSSLSGMLLALSLDQTAARLETMALPPIHISADAALEIARENRLDWMNARARLVDVWRQIDRSASALQSGLSFTANGQLLTLKNKSFVFDGRTGNLNFGLRFDTPLDRLAERNDYRESVIDYQRARRELDEFEDRVSQSLRNTIRIAELSQLNFELRRAAVQVAISQVDLARLRLGEPPKPGAAAVFGATTARDLVSALSDLLDAQNDFVSLWVSYKVLRTLLDFEMGTMQLTADGRWLDPGPFTEEAIRQRLVTWTTATEGKPKQKALQRFSSK